MGSSAAQRRRRRQWTLALVTTPALLEGADEQLLPAVYKEVGEALGVSPTALGSLTLCRALVQAVCYPLATCAAARYDRARVVAAGAFLWAVATLLVGASGTFLQSFCSPIFAEIVPEKARTTVYALDRCFETVFASFAPPLVGILAERVFGYQPAASGRSVEAERENAAALGKAVFAEIAVPVAVCCLAYTGLYWTYPTDREHAQTAALQASLAAHAAGADCLNQALDGTRTE